VVLGEDAEVGEVGGCGGGGELVEDVGDGGGCGVGRLPGEVEAGIVDATEIA